MQESAEGQWWNEGEQGVAEGGSQSPWADPSFSALAPGTGFLLSSPRKQRGSSPGPNGMGSPGLGHNPSTLGLASPGLGPRTQRTPLIQAQQQGAQGGKAWHSQVRGAHRVPCDCCMLQPGRHGLFYGRKPLPCIFVPHVSMTEGMRT